MNLEVIQDFILEYGTASIIISLVSAIITLIVEKIFGNKIPIVIKNYLPVILALITQLIFDLICENITIETLSAGLIAGSLATVILVIIKKIKRGENITLDLLVLFIEGLLEGKIEDNKKSVLALSIASLIRKEKDNTILEEKIKDAIKENSNGIISDAEIYLIAKSIISSTKNQSKN